MARTLLRTFAFITATFIATSCVQAEMTLSGTRIIYNENKNDTSIRLENKGQRPLLAQVWLDDGNDAADPSTLKVPFTLTPPVSRVEAKRGQTVKIMFNGTTALPKDRESVFWFNALEVPPKSSAADSAGKNILQLAFRTRIKLFYRPQGLQGTSSEAPALLNWKAQQRGGKTVLHVTNPTPYYVSFNNVELEANGRKFTVAPDMVPPKSTHDLTVNGLASVPSAGSVSYTAISDYGGAIDGKKTL